MYIVRLTEGINELHTPVHLHKRILNFELN